MPGTTPFREPVDPAEVVVVVLGGGRGNRLHPLTRDRAKPAVSFGGKYRLIDIPLSNCLRSKFERIFILTQFNSFSLNRHIWQAYSSAVRGEGFVEVVAAEQTQESQDWFQGTADAVRQSLKHILYRKPRYVLILSGDQIYSMDYRDLLLWHKTQQADVTIAAKFASAAEVTGLGVVKVDRDMSVVGFCEKPKCLDEVAGFQLDEVGGVDFPANKPFLVSMGLYLFDTEALLTALDNDEEDFGKGVIPQTAQQRTMSCYPFDGYWRDVGTIEAFHTANMDWRAGGGIAAMFQEGNAIITHSRQLPPSRIHGTVIEESLIADGCHLLAERISRSVVGVRSRIGPGSVIEDSIIMGNDTPNDGSALEIGANCHIRRAIVDKNVVLGSGCTIANTQGIDEADDELYAIRSGIVILPKGAVIPPGTEI